MENDKDNDSDVFEYIGSHLGRSSSDTGLRESARAWYNHEREKNERSDAKIVCT